MSVLINKANLSGVMQLGSNVAIAKSNLYAILQAGVSIRKANAYAILEPLPYYTIGEVFPFTLSVGIWATPFYVKRKGING